MIDLPGQIKDIGTTEIFEDDDIPAHHRAYFMSDYGSDDSGYSESCQQPKPHDKRFPHPVLHRTVQGKEIGGTRCVAY